MDQYVRKFGPHNVEIIQNSEAFFAVYEARLRRLSVYGLKESRYFYGSEWLKIGIFIVCLEVA
jgi:hypothetical protein